MSSSVYILGISAFFHDSAACLLCNGEIVAAAQQERFSRIKHDEAFPQEAINYCLAQGGITVNELTHVVFYEKPFIKFERLLSTYVAYAPRGLKSFLRAMPIWLKEKIFIKSIIQEKLGYRGEVYFTEHHESHAASAFYPSPFKEAAIITFDGVGEWATTSIAKGQGNQCTLLHDIRFPNSLGLLYSAFTYYLGFKVNSGEYKVMGLAPYGEPIYASLIREHLIDLKDDGSFRLNMDYMNFAVGLTMTNNRFHQLFGGEPRKPETPLTQRHMDIAASIQRVTEEVMVRVARFAKSVTGMKDLCLAGGVALNGVGNGAIIRERLFDNIWVQPASGDAGGALGAALTIWHQHLQQPRYVNGKADAMKGAFLGPDVESDVEHIAHQQGWVYEKLNTLEIPRRVAQLLAKQHIVAVCHGRMEFGPRALGHRSILADPRNPQMQSTINLSVKFRESFRPFAPAILAHEAKNYVDLTDDSPYMLVVTAIKESKRVRSHKTVRPKGLELLKEIRSTLPAVTHVDYTVRLQTVDQQRNEFLYNILHEFHALTGCPAVINTSFNVRGEPIVCTGQDAYRCFMCTEIDYLLIGNLLFKRTEQPAQEKYQKEQLVSILD